MVNTGKPLVILAGPTAVGKTELSILLAKKINGEIISADSMQVYRGMDIGTAKITKDEMQGIEHYLIDIFEPDEEFNVVEFQTRAKEAMDIIWAHGNIPIIVGGTGFYIQSVLYDIDFNEEHTDTKYREFLENEARDKGCEYLHEKLKEVDPESAKIIHANNLKRVIRALEYYKETGKKISVSNEEQRNKVSPYNFCYFVLNDDREKIYKGIDKRVDIMIDNGLVSEVEGLVNKGYNLHNISMLGLGYKEIVDYLEGRTSLDEAVRLIKRDTRHFAKKQLTWFKREKEVCWIDKGEASVMLEKMSDVLKEKNII